MSERWFMSCYDLSRLLFDLKMNESVYQKSLNDFEAVMADYDLSAKKKTRSAPAIRASCASWACTACSVFTSNGCNPQFRDNIYWAQK